MKLNLFGKVFFTLIAILAVLGAVYALSHMMGGNFLSTVNPIIPIFYLVVFVGILYLIVKGVRKLWLVACICILYLGSCHYAKSNQQVVVSEDCGMTWKKINVGDAVPREGMNRCYMKVVVPNYPMQGDCRFVSNFDGKVRAVVHIDYDYNITDILAFIKQAKYLGTANADADSEDALNSAVFEGAENSVIDKRIREVSKAIFAKEDIVELNQADIELLMHNESNKILEPLGIHLNFVTLTFDLDEQTRQAIDVATAMKVYESKNLVDVGKAVMIARAGATKMIVENVKHNEEK